MGSDLHRGQRGAGPRSGTQRGFTATELLIVIAIAAILASIAAPSMVRIMQTNRVATEATQFVSDLQYARSEAIRQGGNVTICPSTTGSSCTGGLNWQIGWIMFSDPNASRTFDSGEMLIRHQPGWTGTDTMTASATALGTLSFSRDGFLIGVPASGRFVLATTPAVATLTRCVLVNVTGRQQVVPVNGGSCP